MEIPGFQFRLWHLAAGVIWISIFLAVISGQGYGAVFAAAIGNILTLLVPIVFCVWLVMIRSEISKASSRSRALVIAMVHWMNIFYFMCLMTLVILVAAIAQYCWEFGNLAVGLLTLLSMPLGILLGWKFVAAHKKKPSAEG